MKEQDRHFLSIKQIFPDTINVAKPAITGMIHNVYIVECPNNKYVCRFSQKSVAEHNLQISNLLYKYNIKAPHISIHNCGEYYCETYSFIPGKTLHERLIEGLSGSKLDEVYNQIFDISYKIENIPCDNIIKISSPLFSKCLRLFISILKPSKRKLCHTDLHAKNIVLDDDDNVYAILDLDSIAVKPTSVGQFIIIKDAQTYGYDVNKFKSMLKNTNTKDLKLLFLVAKAYKKVVPETLRKQILKVRVK